MHVPTSTICTLGQCSWCFLCRHQLVSDHTHSSLYAAGYRWVDLWVVIMPVASKLQHIMISWRKALCLSSICFHLISVCLYDQLQPDHNTMHLIADGSVCLHSLLCTHNMHHTVCSYYLLFRSGMWANILESKHFSWGVFDNIFLLCAVLSGCLCPWPCKEPSLVYSVRTSTHFTHFLCTWINVSMYLIGTWIDSIFAPIEPWLEVLISHQLASCGLMDCFWGHFMVPLVPYICTFSMIESYISKVSSSHVFMW